MSKEEIRLQMLAMISDWHQSGHEAAQRSAMIYSFFAICKKHEVNPYKWLKHTLLNIASINHKNIKDLYPQNFKKSTDIHRGADPQRGRRLGISE